MLCVTVRFLIRPESAERFWTLMNAQAAASLAHEPGCLRFDVWRAAAEPATVFLYEIYEDRAAFEAHLRTEHYRAFDLEAGALALSKDVGLWDEEGGR